MFINLLTGYLLLWSFAVFCAFADRSVWTVALTVGESQDWHRIATEIQVSTGANRSGRQSVSINRVKCNVMKTVLLSGLIIIHPVVNVAVARNSGWGQVWLRPKSKTKVWSKTKVLDFGLSQTYLTQCRPMLTGRSFCNRRRTRKIHCGQKHWWLQRLL